MADTKLSNLTALTAVATGDLLEILDISDTSMAASGTNKKITRANLLNIGSDVQAWDADLDALAGITTQGFYARTAANTWTQRQIAGTSGRITVTNPFGLAGDPTIDVGANVYTSGGTDVAVADGGTGSSTAATARTALGVPQDVNPGWTTWSPTTGGYSADPTTTSYSWMQLGKLVILSIGQGVNGTSNAATKSLTLPVTAATRTNGGWGGVVNGAFDNGTWLTTPSLWRIGSASTIIAFDKAYGALNGWTASAGHRITSCLAFYEAA